jgi:hypothetical protein
MRTVIPTHYITRDYQFPGDAVFPKGTLATRGAHAFMLVDENGNPLGAFTGKTARIGDTVASYDIGEDMARMLRVIPNVRYSVKERGTHLNRARRCEVQALKAVSEFVERRKRSA